MPTYEYRCSDGHLFEQFQRMSEDPVRECPQCGAPAERLLSSGAGLLFKGSGFYITDYRSDAYRKAADADSGSSSKEKPADKPAAGTESPGKGSTGGGGSSSSGSSAGGSSSGTGGSSAGGSGASSSGAE